MVIILVVKVTHRTAGKQVRENTDPMVYIVDYLSGGRYTSWWIRRISHSVTVGSKVEINESTSPMNERC